VFAVTLLKLNLPSSLEVVPETIVESCAFKSKILAYAIGLLASSFIDPDTI